MLRSFLASLSLSFFSFHPFRPFLQINITWCLNVRLFEAVAFRQVVELVRVLLTAVENAHRNGIYDVDASHSGRGTFPCASFDLIGQIVHCLLELEGGLLERRQEAPPLQTQRAPFAFVQQRAAEGFVHGVARPIVPPLVPRHAFDGRPPPLAVEAPQNPPPLVALAPEQASESPLELLAGTGVNHGVDAAVEVAQPKYHLKYGVGRFQGGKEGTCRDVKPPGMFVSTVSPEILGEKKE